jgi:hypothetical protein
MSQRTGGCTAVFRQSTTGSGFDADVADAAYEIVGDGFSLFHRHDLDRVGMVVGAENKSTVGDFDVFDRAGAVLADGIHVGLTPAVRFERVVMAIEEDGGAREEARIHAHATASVNPNDDKAHPRLAIAFGLGAQAAEEDATKLQEFPDTHAHNEGLSGGHATVDDKDIVELPVARGRDAGSFVDLLGIEQVEDGEVLNLEDLVHPLKAQAALAVQEIGDVGLAEASFFGQSQASQFAVVNTLPKAFAEVFL